MSLMAHDTERSVAAAEVTMRRFSARVHMIGWEAFGLSEEDAPETRELASGEERWPPGEVTDGVAGMFVHTYGDDPSGAYILVFGPDHAAVVAAWTRARDAFAHFRVRVWGR